MQCLQNEGSQFADPKDPLFFIMKKDNKQAHFTGQVEECKCPGTDEFLQ